MSEERESQITTHIVREVFISPYSCLSAQKGFESLRNFSRLERERDREREILAREKEEERCMNTSWKKIDRFAFIAKASVTFHLAR